MSQFIKFYFTSSMLNMFLVSMCAGAHIETRTHNQCGDTIEKAQAPDDGCINVRNMLSIEEVK